MTHGLISVIMPVHNSEKRLELSINSILNQTYKNIELLLVNDGSIDASPMICDKYSKFDSRVKVIHQKNAGVSTARNRGIKESKGQFITFVDSDDIIDSNTFEEVMKQQLDESLDIIIFGMRFDYYKEDKLVKSKVLSMEKNMCFYIQNIKDLFFNLYEKNYLTPVWNKIIKASIIKENNIEFEKEMSILEDFKFVLDVLENSQKVCILSYPYYKYYHDILSSSLKRRPNIDYTKNFQILDKKIRAFSEKLLFDKDVDLKKINGLMIRYYLIAIEKLFSSSLKIKDKYTEMKRIIYLKEFQYALDKKNIMGLRLKLRFICFLLKSRNYRIVFLLFYLNDKAR